MPLPCAASSVGDGASCSLPLIITGSAALSAREKGALREVHEIIIAINWLFGAATHYMVFLCSLEFSLTR